jgi:HPr kinase/phosphorylase
VICVNAREFLIGAEKSFPCSVLSGEGLDRGILESAAIVYDGTGPEFWSRVKPGQIVVAGPEGLRLFPAGSEPDFACLFLSSSTPCPPSLFKPFREKCIPVICSGIGEEHLASRIAGLIREKLEHTIFAHGCLVSYRGTGLLITGESGTGKSSCCLDLLLDGARLVADDLVEIHRDGCVLTGKSPEKIKNLIEIKGLGIHEVSSLMGSDAVLDESRIDLVFELTEEGPLEGTLSLIGLEIPLIRLSPFSSRSVSDLVKEALVNTCR